MAASPIYGQGPSFPGFGAALRLGPAEPDNRIFIAIAISLLIHTASLFLIPEMRTSEPPMERLIEVSLVPEKKAEVPPAPRPKEQIISPPQLPPVKEAPETPFKSDFNTKTDHEQIKKGQTPVVKPPAPSPKAAAAKERSEQPPARDLSKTKLTLDENALSELAARPEESKSNPSALRQLSNYHPFTRQPTPVDQILSAGSSDFLPKIPDGEMTLLNAKADQYAIFVRRVASQVFGKVRQLQWQSIPAGEVLKIHDFVTIEAILSPQGKLLKVTLHEGSGSAPFDRMITRSAEEGANDLNPPPGARAEDGNIHFVFQSRCWTRPAMGRLGESRWLLLATGLL